MTAAAPYDLGKPMQPDMNAAAVVSGVVQSASECMAIQRVRFTLSSVRCDILAANDYGSAELFTLPAKNVIVIGCEIDLSIVKTAVTNGVQSTTDLDIALGTAAASNTTLSTTMLNIMPKQDVDTDALTVTSRNHSLATTPVLTGILDATTNKVYFNVSAIGGITADDYLLVSGTVDLFILDLRNVTG